MYPNGIGFVKLNIWAFFSQSPQSFVEIEQFFFTKMLKFEKLFFFIRTTQLEELYSRENVCRLCFCRSVPLSGEKASFNTACISPERPLIIKSVSHIDFYMRNSRFFSFEECIHAHSPGNKLKETTIPLFH